MILNFIGYDVSMIQCNLKQTEKESLAFEQDQFRIRFSDSLFCQRKRFLFGHVFQADTGIAGLFPCFLTFLFITIDIE